jgi:NHL repeat
MTLRLVPYAALITFSVTLSAQQSAMDALQKARVWERLAEKTPASRGGNAPKFVVDPAWPKPLPHNWLIGGIGGIFVDRRDHIWVFNRPRSLNSTDSGLQADLGKDAKNNPVSALGFPRPFGQVSGCCTPAPAVLEFDKAGNLLQAWGGPSDPGFLEKKCRQQDGCFWPAREHGIYVDHNDFVYVAGNGQARNFYGQFPWATSFGNDSHILKFKTDGTFVMQIGMAGAKGPNSNDTSGGVNGTPEPFWPAEMLVDPKTNLLYVADGYGNRRVLIVDAATGKYVGHFGAYGQNPVTGENAGFANADEGTSWPAEFRHGDPKPKFFRSPLHCAKLANDGQLYVCDRSNNRIQIFKASEVGKVCANPDGAVGKCGYVAEFLVSPETASGTADAVEFSADPKQSCLYIADLTNDTVYIVNRQNLTELGRFGRRGRQAGELHGLHSLAADMEGNVYTGEVDTTSGGRVQRYLRYGPTGCSGTGTSEIGKYIP